MSRREYFREENRLKKLSVVFSVVLVLTIVAFVFIFNLYNKKLQNQARSSLLELGSVNAVVPNQIENGNEILQPVSSSQDKDINTVKNEVIKEHSSENIISNMDNISIVPRIANNDENLKDRTKITEDVTEETASKLENENSIDNLSIEQENQTQISNQTIGQNEYNSQNLINSENYELSFIAPVSGEIIKDFSNDNLVYSKTLDEWTMHYGIDIRADKMSIVLASETGIVDSIKNDPRYGLTITIAHQNGYKTVYSNLLSSEFVKEGDVVEKGQTIGTVGESASFEIADDPHLHFEIMKDGEYLNPTIYLR